MNIFGECYFFWSVFFCGVLWMTFTVDADGCLRTYS